MWHVCWFSVEKHVARPKSPTFLQMVKTLLGSNLKIRLLFHSVKIQAQYRVLLKEKNWIFGIIHCISDVVNWNAKFYQENVKCFNFLFSGFNEESISKQVIINFNFLYIRVKTNNISYKYFLLQLGYRDIREKIKEHKFEFT